MSEDASSEQTVPRIPVEAPWLLGAEAECLIDGRHLTLRAARVGVEERLSWLEFDRRSGCVLHFRSIASPIASHCLEVAGLGRDAHDEIVFPDEATAGMVVGRLERLFAQLR